MTTQPVWKMEVDAEGRLVLPPEARAALGLTPGECLVGEWQGASLSLQRSPQALARVYIEPTNLCNLDCTTCMRNVWDEPAGMMTEQVFERILQGMAERQPRPAAFFGGFGEPLSHPRILEMVRQVKSLGVPVELITNAVLLTKDMAAELVNLGLDRLWFSLDGASPESYADVRLGAALPQVLANLEHLAALKTAACTRRPELGLAFVAMRRNIADLPEVLKLGQRVGVNRTSISHVLAHTRELNDERLYTRRMYAASGPEISLPSMDWTPDTTPVLAELLDRMKPPAGLRRCPFVEKGSTAIRWDGAVSPCLPLLHDHTAYLGEHERRSKSFSCGNILDQSLSEIWSAAPYQALRERLQMFDFSPCVICNSCDMPYANEEDCFGNEHPTCGGCLWAAGLIQCP